MLRSLKKLPLVGELFARYRPFCFDLDGSSQKSGNLSLDIICNLLVAYCHEHERGLQGACRSGPAAFVGQASFVQWPNAWRALRRVPNVAAGGDEAPCHPGKSWAGCHAKAGPGKAALSESCSDS